MTFFGETEEKDFDLFGTKGLIYDLFNQEKGLFRANKIKKLNSLLHSCDIYKVVLRNAGEFFCRSRRGEKKARKQRPL